MKSFTRGAENLEKDTESCLSFINKFDGRNIKGEYDWNKDIYRNLEEFLLTNTSNKYAYQIFLDTHASIAFAAEEFLIVNQVSTYFRYKNRRPMALYYGM